MCDKNAALNAPFYMRKIQTFLWEGLTDNYFMDAKLQNCPKS